MAAARTGPRGCEEPGGPRSNYRAISAGNYKLASADLQARCAMLRPVGALFQHGSPPVRTCYERFLCAMATRMIRWDARRAKYNATPPVIGPLDEQEAHAGYSLDEESRGASEEQQVARAPPEFEK